MKIELTCSNCHSVLRVDQQHAGKQLRCPTCGTVNSIPLSGESIEDDGQIEVVSRKPDSAPVEPDPVYSAPTPRKYIGPHSAPLNPDRSEYRVEPHPGQFPNRTPLGGHNDENLGRSYLMFGLGVASFFLCGCFYLVITPTLFVSGMNYAKKSRDTASSTAFGLNLAGLVLWGLITFAFFGFAVIGL